MAKNNKDDLNIIESEIVIYKTEDGHHPSHHGRSIDHPIR